MNTIIEIKQERKKLVNQAREILTKAEVEKRDLTAEDNAHYEKIMADVDKMADKIAKLEKVETEERKYSDISDKIIKPENVKTEIVEKVETRKAFANYLKGGFAGMTLDEKRALQMDSDPAGGYTVAPQMFVSDLLKNIDNETFIMQMANVIRVEKAESLGMPYLNANPADPTWVGEISIGSVDSTMTFGKRELHPHPLAQYIKVSNKLLRASALDVDSLVIDRLKYKLAVVMENAFLNGTGAGQPLGVFTASADGITTGRDVSTGNTSTEIRFDGLINAKYSMKSQYWPKLKWIFHRDAVKMIRKLKDGEGQYLWEASTQAGQPDRILGIPVMMSEYVPNTFTTTLYVGILGDFSKYTIAIALDMTIQRLVELYAATNQTGYISRMEADGMPVLEEAFARVKLA